MGRRSVDADPLPQQPMPVRAEIAGVDWLFEPFWPGDRLIVRSEQVALPGVADAIRADSAVLDGVLSAHPFPGEDRRAFVAIDLLELDGDSLLDVPLLERRRLLASVVAENDQVRLSPAVKHPIGGWLESWRAAGFTHYVAKRQNARYAPGEQNDDWLKVPIARESGGGFVGRLVGSRGRVRRIGD